LSPEAYENLHIAAHENHEAHIDRFMAHQQIQAGIKVPGAVSPETKLKLLDASVRSANMFKQHRAALQEGLALHHAAYPGEPERENMALVLHYPAPGSGAPPGNPSDPGTHGQG
jgi:hypothetical protein